MSSAANPREIAPIAPRHRQLTPLPDEVAEKFGAALAKLVTGSGYLLDLGCGAGRVALPAASTGIGVFGFDSDLHLLAESQRAADAGALPMAVGCAELTRLPMLDASVPAVLAYNLPELTSEWRRALAEAVRVLRPGGVFIHASDWLDPASCAERLRSRLREEVARLRPELSPSETDPSELAQALAAHSGTSDPEIIVATWTSPQSPSAMLAQLAERNTGEHLVLDEAQMSEVLRRVRDWATETWPDLDAVEPVEHRFVLSVTRGLRNTTSR